MLVWQTYDAPSIQHWSADPGTDGSTERLPVKRPSLRVVCFTHVCITTAI